MFVLDKGSFFVLMSQTLGRLQTAAELHSAVQPCSGRAGAPLVDISGRGFSS